MNYLDELAGQIRAEVSDEDVLPTPDTRLLFRLYALLALSNGADVQPADVHDAWVVWMLEHDPDHRSIRHFDELDEPTRQSDMPFVEAIRKVARTLPPRRPFG